MQMNPYLTFKEECAREIEAQGGDETLRQASRDWMNLANRARYSYHFEWLGRPVIQYPQDLVAMQELMWRIKPDLVIETGVAHGGSLVFFASMLELNAVCGGPADATVLGIDIEIRAHNRSFIEAHPLARRIRLIQGSSTNATVVAEARRATQDRRKVMVSLDSNHTHDHVLAELQAYAPLVSAGSYCMVFDTVIEHMPRDMFPDRAWGPGNNPMTAVKAFLERHAEFEIDQEMDAKLLISVAPGGFLRRRV